MSENTKIVQCFLPPMTAGSYTAQVSQSLRKEKESLQNITKTFNFGVDAARFSLSPNDIYSVFPPANKSGNYSEALPQMVFTRRTLPWERTIDGKIPVFQREETAESKRNPQDSPPVPWMALLLFTEEEMEDLQINKNTIGNVIQPNLADGIVRPEIFKTGTTAKNVLMLMDWEKATDAVLPLIFQKNNSKKIFHQKKAFPY